MHSAQHASVEAVRGQLLTSVNEMLSLPSGGIALLQQLCLKFVIKQRWIMAHAGLLRECVQRFFQNNAYQPDLCVLLEMAITFTVEDTSQTYNILQMQNDISTSTAVVITQSLHACAPGGNLSVKFMQKSGKCTR